MRHEEGMLSGKHLPTVGAGAAATVAAAALIAIAGITGCGRNTTPERDGAPPGDHSRQLTATEEVLIERAEQLLVKKCMERAGFRYWVTPVEDAESRKGASFVLDDIGWAKKHGYGGRFKRQAEETRRNGPNGAYAEALPQHERLRYREVLDGTPSQGMLSAALPGGGSVMTPRRSCHVEAKSRLYGDFETWFRVEKTATHLTPLYVPDLSRDRRFTSALRAWSSCMRDKGMHYADPFEIREKIGPLTEALSDASAHAVEVKIAVAEAECADRSSLAETARTLETEYRASHTRRYRADVAAFQRLRLTALQRAKDVVGP
jgi:hypothetical protein